MGYKPYQPRAQIAAPAPAPSCPAPVPAGDVLAMCERARARLMKEHEKTAAEAEVLAPAIVRGELHNDARMEPVQEDMARCLICGKADMDGEPLAPILSAAPGRQHRIHTGACHAAHMRRQEAKVTACMVAAGLVLSRML